MSGKRIAPRGAVTFQTVAAVACKLPEVEISTSYGTPALKVRGKLHGAAAPGRRSRWCCAPDFLDRQILMQADPETFFITEHYRDYPLVLMRLDESARARLCPNSWSVPGGRLLPKTLVAKFDAARN